MNDREAVGATGNVALTQLLPETASNACQRHERSPGGRPRSPQQATRCSDSNIHTSILEKKKKTRTLTRFGTSCAKIDFHPVFLCHTYNDQIKFWELAAWEGRWRGNADSGGAIFQDLCADSIFCPPTLSVSLLIYCATDSGSCNSTLKLELRQVISDRLLVAPDPILSSFCLCGSYNFIFLILLTHKVTWKVNQTCTCDFIIPV